MHRIIIATIVHHIVHALLYHLIYLTEHSRCRVSAYISRGRHDGLMETRTEGLRKLLVRHSYAHTIIVAKQILCQIVGSVVDDGERLHCHIEQVVCHFGHIYHIMVEMVYRVEQHQHSLIVGSLFQVVNPLHCRFVGGIASYSPYCVGWIQYQASIL